jgi:hypothetical protein
MSKLLKIKIDDDGGIFINREGLSDIETIGLCELIRTRYIVLLGRRSDKLESDKELLGTEGEK